MNIESGGDVVDVNKIIIHPNFNPRTHNNDISLLNLSSDITLGEMQTNAVSLPDSGSDPSDGNYLMVAGWGRIKEGDIFLSNYLIKVSVPVVSRSSCQSVYKSEFTITDNMICAGFKEGGKDSCQVWLFENVT